jgi:glycosyltransferase involved in cell wall biosynthesis
MSIPPRIICTVTNDLNYDQRMQRICTTLSEEGYEVWLVGRHLPGSKPLTERPFRQIRLHCWNHKGFLFYAEFNVRLFFFLIFTRFDAVGTVDLDTMPAGATAAFCKNKKRVFDAHEYFTEVPEVVNRPLVKAFWTWVERLFLPFYRHAYTVGPALAALFAEKYGLPFAVVRNVPNTVMPIKKKAFSGKKILLYQGALNEGRGIEALISAMAFLPDAFELYLAGEGDLSKQLRERASYLQVDHKVFFLGFVPPETLRARTQEAWLGFNLLENKGLSYYFSLANKFFDYVQAGVPTITMDFPEYRALNNLHEVAVLLPALQPEKIAAAVLQLAEDTPAYQHLVAHCATAATVWNWENEKTTLLSVWQNALNGN